MNTQSPETAPAASTTAARDIEVDTESLDRSITEFVGRNSQRYIAVFHRIHNAQGWIPVSFNLAAAVFGPLWAAARGLWGMFWTFLLLEMIAWARLGKGLWGNPGASFAERAEKQQSRAADFLERVAEAEAAGQDPSRFQQLADNLTRAATESQAKADAASAEALGLVLTGLLLLLAIKLLQGVMADTAYEKQYSRWRISREQAESAFSPSRLALGVFLTLAIAPVSIYKFTVSNPPEVLNSFPEKAVSSFILSSDERTLFSTVATWLEAQIDAAAAAGGDLFDGITYGVRTVLDALTVALSGTPWPVVMLIIIVTAWRSAGPRVAIFTSATLAYIALLGYWEVAMETVALVGAAVIICVAAGIPLGIWFGKSRRAYAFAEPVLDLMQTLPAFVYLIPIIAFFGTGNPPGILATIIFGMPPVIRLTALGVRGVPESIKEASVAFGASRWQLLRDVEVPLALPSIMTGVNQTILMCLSMVVIISLIGGGGLGKVILEALQYAAKGPGLLGGFAILFCAMVIDRIVQGAFRRRDQR